MQHKGRNGVGKLPKNTVCLGNFPKKGAGGAGIPIFLLSFGGHFFVLEIFRNVVKHIINKTK